MIECSMCRKKDYHYSEKRSTSIGCYEFSYPFERKYVCDNCIKRYINNLEKNGICRVWWPIEIKR